MQSKKSYTGGLYHILINAVSRDPKVGRLIMLCLQVRQSDVYFMQLHVRLLNVCFTQLHVWQSDFS